MMDKEFIYRHTGSPRQLIGAEPMRLSEGKADGVRAIRLYNSTGMEAVVLPDRGMDIASLKLCGYNVGFLSKTGITGSQYFTEDGSKGFLRSFYVGFLTTCGLSYMGAAHKDGEQELGLHGLFSNIPATNCFCSECWKDGRLAAVAKGTVCQAQVFQENIALIRTIELDGEKNILQITDHIENRAFNTTPFMLLYHMNYGYPLLSETTQICLPTSKIVPRNNYAAAGLELYNSFETPDDTAEEQVFLHRMKANADGMTSYAVYNRSLGFGVQVSYSTLALPYLTQWKCMRSGEYVLGLEPGNCHVNGRKLARQDGSLQILHPMEERDVQITVTGLSSNKMIDHAIEQIRDMH